jgi:transketolase
MKKMRQQFVDTISEIAEFDEKLILLLGDIGVHGFKKVFEDYPLRSYNLGILEQSSISLASGLSMLDFKPVVHTIAPFLVERAYEQLKLDFGYQKLGGNFVSVGASYDYANLGCTHHCPGDVGILMNIPNMSIILPGTAKEFDSLFKQAYSNKNPNYFRLSESLNNIEIDVKYCNAQVIKTGTLATVLAIGPMLDPVIEATKDIDVTILYYTTIIPFDSFTLYNNLKNSKIIICEPYYKGALTWLINETFENAPISILNIGIPREFISDYGNMNDHNNFFGLDAKGINSKIINFI